MKPDTSGIKPNPTPIKKPTETPGDWTHLSKGPQNPL